MSDRALMHETVYDIVLERIGDVPDDDVEHTRIVLQSIVDEIRGYKDPRPHVIAGLEQLIGLQIDAGRLRALVRDAIAGLSAEQALR